MLNRKLCLALICYACVAPFLGWLVRSWVPWMAGATFKVGFVGGGLCLLWGLLAWLGRRVRAGAILTLAVMAFVILSDTVTMWMERKFCKMSLALTVLMGLTVLLLTALAHDFGGPREGCADKDQPQPR